MAERKAKWQNDYIARTYDRINLTVPKGKKEIIQSAAKASGESVNSYINHAIDLLMGGGYGFQSGSEKENISSPCVSHAALFSETEHEKLTAILQDGQTIEDFIKVAVRDKLEMINEGEKVEM